MQRRWVLLEGIFFGSADIQTLLSKECNSFKNIDNEFLNLYKKSQRKPKVVDAVQMDNAQKSVESLGDGYTKVQKALGD